MKKFWYESKTVWGLIIAAVFAIFGNLLPGFGEFANSIMIAALAWAGYGFRDAMK